MDFRVGTMNTTVRTGEAEPAFERIVAAVLERVRQEMARDQRIDGDRQLRPASSAEQSISWEMS